MQDVLMPAVDIHGNPAIKTYALAMCCRPTSSQWAKFEDAIRRSGAFAGYVRHGGIVSLRLDESRSWDEGCRFADQPCTLEEMPVTIMNELMAPPKLTLAGRR